jgi:hypothetical protein
MRVDKLKTGSKNLEFPTLSPHTLHATRIGDFQVGFQVAGLGIVGFGPGVNEPITKTLGWLLLTKGGAWESGLNRHHPDALGLF